MRPKIRSIASRHPLNLNSTLYPTRPSLLLTRLLPSIKHHTSTSISSKVPRNNSFSSSQTRAKARYEHVYTTFHQKNGYTAPIFKTFPADMATRAGYTVTDANSARDCSEKNPLSKGRSCGSSKLFERRMEKSQMTMTKPKQQSAIPTSAWRNLR